MSDQTTRQTAEQPDQDHQFKSQKIDQNSEEQSELVDVMDLVYKGGYSRDPQEILSNPAVAPQTLSEGRDLRVDLFYDAEEAIPESSVNSSSVSPDVPAD